MDRAKEGPVPGLHPRRGPDLSLFRSIQNTSPGCPMGSRGTCSREIYGFMVSLPRMIFRHWGPFPGVGVPSEPLPAVFSSGSAGSVPALFSRPDSTFSRNVSAKAFSTFWQALITFSPSLPGRIDIHAYGASPFHRQDNVLDSDRISGRPWSAGSASAGPRSPPSRSQSPEASCRTPCSGTSRRPAAALPARPPPRHRRFSR